MLPNTHPQFNLYARRLQLFLYASKTIQIRKSHSKPVQREEDEAYQSQRNFSANPYTESTRFIPQVCVSEVETGKSFWEESRSFISSANGSSFERGDEILKEMKKIEGDIQVRYTDMQDIDPPVLLLPSFNFHRHNCS